jgi:hypothetical protein
MSNCKSCKVCTRPLLTQEAPRGVTRFRFLGRTLDPWGTSGGRIVGAVRYRDLGPCDELVGIHAGLYDGAGEPLEGVGSMIDSFTARRQTSQRNWPQGISINALPIDGPTWARYRQVMEMRVTTGSIRASASRAREAYFDNFAQGWDMPGDYQSPDYAPEVVVMYAYPQDLRGVQFDVALDYRNQKFCQEGR